MTLLALGGIDLWEASLLGKRTIYQMVKERQNGPEKDKELTRIKRSKNREMARRENTKICH